MFVYFICFRSKYGKAEKTEFVGIVQFYSEDLLVKSNLSAFSITVTGEVNKNIITVQWQCSLGNKLQNMHCLS